VKHRQNRQDRLRALAADLSNPVASAISIYWAIQTLNLRATDTGISFDPPTGRVIETIPGAIDRHLADFSSPIGQALRQLRDSRAPNLSETTHHHSQETLHEKIAEVRRADDGWRFALLHQPHYAEEILDNLTPRLQSPSFRIIRCVSRGPARLTSAIFSRTRRFRLRCESGIIPPDPGLIARLERLEAEADRIDGPLDEHKRIFRKIDALRRFLPLAATDAELALREAVDELRDRWVGQFGPISTSPAEVGWIELHSALEALGETQRNRRFKLWKAGRDLAEKAHKKPQNSDARVYDPKNWVVAGEGQRGCRLPLDRRHPTCSCACPQVEPIEKNQPPIGIIPLRPPLKFGKLFFKEQRPEIIRGVFDQTAFGRGDDGSEPLKLSEKEREKPQPGLSITARSLKAELQAEEKFTTIIVDAEKDPEGGRYLPVDGRIHFRPHHSLGSIKWGEHPFEPPYKWGGRRTGWMVVGRFSRLTKFQPPPNAQQNQQVEMVEFKPGWFVNRKLLHLVRGRHDERDAA
jgi:hypothetical protein